MIIFGGNILIRYVLLLEFHGKDFGSFHSCVFGAIRIECLFNMRRKIVQFSLGTQTRVLNFKQNSTIRLITDVILSLTYD